VLDRAAKALRLPASPDHLRDSDWTGLLEALARSDSDQIIGEGYAICVEQGREAPPTIRAASGTATTFVPGEVIVTADRELAKVFVDTATPFLLAATAEAEQLLRDRWALRSDADTVDTRSRSYLQVRPSRSPTCSRCCA
jgi:hypothetical protein